MATGNSFSLRRAGRVQLQCPCAAHIRGGSLEAEQAFPGRDFTAYSKRAMQRR